MENGCFVSARRRAVAAALVTAAFCGVAPPGQTQAVVAFPAYRAEHALQGLYAHHYPARWQAFEREAAALLEAARRHCAGQDHADGLSAAWVRARLAWMAASSPALGSVVTRRSHREIDFWPVRPVLLQRALASQPRTLVDMARVGGPAKGFPAMEALLASAQPALRAAHCPYLVLIAEGIDAEAKALSSAFAGQATRDWTADEDAARNALAEWLNQWLGGLENLRWQQMAQPIQKAHTTGSGLPPAFARQRMADNRADWQVQWASLRVQARLAAQAQSTPPVPGESLVPIEALLLGKGHIVLAQRWGQVIDTATSAMAALAVQPSERELQALSQTLKAVATLYQNEVASALDVPLGFSSADGD